MGSQAHPHIFGFEYLKNQGMNMRAKIRRSKPQPLLEALFRGTDLRGYIEANRVKTLDNFTGEGEKCQKQRLRNY